MSLSRKFTRDVIRSTSFSIDARKNCVVSLEHRPTGKVLKISIVHKDDNRENYVILPAEVIPTFLSFCQRLFFREKSVDIKTKKTDDKTP